MTRVIGQTIRTAAAILLLAGLDARAAEISGSHPPGAAGQVPSDEPRRVKTTRITTDAKAPEAPAVSVPGLVPTVRIAPEAPALSQPRPMPIVRFPADAKAPQAPAISVPRPVPTVRIAPDPAPLPVPIVPVPAQ